MHEILNIHAGINGISVCDKQLQGLEMALFELRQYKIRDGKMAEWLELMHGEIVPYGMSKGMVFVASFCDEEDDSKYIWIRRFEDQADCDRMYKEIYESDHWVNNIKPKIGELMIREEVINHRLIPSQLSPLQ